MYVFTLRKTAALLAVIGLGWGCEGTTQAAPKGGAKPVVKPKTVVKSAPAGGGGGGAKSTASKSGASKSVASRPAASQISFTDPARFSKVKEWEGTFTVSSAKQNDEASGMYRHVWSHSIKVEGSFRLKYYHDPRDGDDYSWRGVGEANVVIDGKRITYPGNLTPIEETYDGSYTDSITVMLSETKSKKGAYIVVIGIDDWQKQAHKGKAIHLVKREGKSVYDTMTSGYRWVADSGAGSLHGSLPQSGFVLNGAASNTTTNIFGHDNNIWKSSWSIRPVGEGFEEPLKADAGGPYEAERGQVVTLNGGKSTGKIRSYKWRFEPVGGNSEIPFNAGSGKEGVRIPTTFLDSVKATLTVSDGKKEDSDTVTIKVKARDYKTAFVHRDGEKLHPQSIAPRMIKGRDLKYAGGENVCALDGYGAKDSVHILHPNNEGGSWENKGYTLKQVQDPGGPFDGLWFLSNYSLRIEREMLINKYILPGGPPPVRTAKPFYESNKALGNDVDAYLEAVRKHELLHSELMKKGLAANDPGPKIEAWASKEKDPLKKQVDETIKGAEDAIDKASADPLPSVGFEGKIAFPDDATDKYVSIDMGI